MRQQASIRDGDGNTALHLACINDDLNTIEALLKPITAAELKEHNRWANQLPQSNACRKLSIDLEQRNFYGKQSHHYILDIKLRTNIHLHAIQYVFMCVFYTLIWP